MYVHDVHIVHEDDHKFWKEISGFGMSLKSAFMLCYRNASVIAGVGGTIPKLK